MAIGTLLAVGSSIFGGIGAGRARRAARRRERAAAARVMALEANRQDIPDFGQDFENPFANLQVATRAAEMQAEQQDISLASTLDTLRATGASAGGATALAMAALKSKKDVAATIESQEAANSKLRAEGEAMMNREKVAAKQQAQVAQIQLKGRKEEADAKGEIFQFQAQEARTNQDINMYQSMYLGLSQAETNLRAAKADAMGDLFGGITGLFTGG